MGDKLERALEERYAEVIEGSPVQKLRLRYFESGNHFPPKGE